MDALEHVYIVQTSQCEEGTQETLNLQFNHSAWARLMDPAIRTANLLTTLIVNNNNSLHAIPDDMMYAMVRNNVHQSSLTYGSGIAIEADVYRYEIFCAYAYKDNGTIVATDISVNYDYRDPTTVWWWGLKNKTFDHINVREDTVMYRWVYPLHNVQPSDDYCFMFRFLETKKIFMKFDVHTVYWTFQINDT